nr:23S rRNA methyltransferase [Micromonospora sp. DSM 115978]
MRTEVLRRLRCPVCGQPFTGAAGRDAGATHAGGRGPASGAVPVAGPVRCPRGHSFDRAKQGYVDLTAGRTVPAGDTVEMVAARAEFLGSGHYDFLSRALADTATRTLAHAALTEPDPTRDGPGPLVVDAGAGTGRHLAAVLDALPAATGLAMDVSKPALRRAARVHPRASAAGCDTWGTLPLADHSAALVLNVFAPRNGPEFHRVLQPGGVLLVATPAADHLGELVGPLGLLRVDPAKARRVADSLAGRFELASFGAYRRPLALTRREVRTLVGMGPSAWHADPDRLTERLATLAEPVTATASIRLATYRPH